LSYDLMENNFGTEEDKKRAAKELLNGVLDLHRDQQIALGEVAAVTSKKPLDGGVKTAQENLLMHWKKIGEMLLNSMDQKVGDMRVPPVVKDYRLAEIETWIAKIDAHLKKPAGLYKDKDNPYFSLKEAKGHLQRLCASLKLSLMNKETRYAAWNFRNMLKVQQVFEQLYMSRALAQGCGLIVTHDLKVYHETLNDPAEMQATKFTFGKGMHYSVAEEAEKGVGPVAVLKHLEAGIKRHLGVEEGFVKANDNGKGMQTQLIIEDDVDLLLSNAMPLMKLHVEKCLEALEAL
jgi:hypothetical protein